MSLTLTQERALAIIPKITGSLGFLSSVVVFCEIVATHRRNRGNPVLRALAGLSIFYMMDALNWSLSTWLVPASSGFAYAAGSIRSCEFQGFWLQAVIAAPIYTAVMAFYFYLVACHGKTNETLVKIEKYIHAAVLIFALGTSFAFLSMDLYNQIGAVCWINGSPPQCGSSTFAGYRSSKDMGIDDPDYISCDRGDYAWIYGMLLFYLPLWICILLLVFFNACIYHNLQQQGSGGNSEAQWVAQQAFLYFVAFTVTWAPSTVWSALHYKNGGFFLLDLMAAICEPLGGVFNLCIFLSNRPTLRRKLWRRLTCRRPDDENNSSNINNEEKTGSSSTSPSSQAASNKCTTNNSKANVDRGPEAPLPKVETEAVANAISSSNNNHHNNGDSV